MIGLMNPLPMAIAGLVALSVVAGAYVKGRVDGRELASADHLRAIASLNGQIKEANDRNRATEQRRRQAFTDVVEARNKNMAMVAKVKAAAAADYQERLGKYEAELDAERISNAARLVEYEKEISDITCGCLLNERDLDRMRRGEAAVD